MCPACAGDDLVVLLAGEVLGVVLAEEAFVIVHASEALATVLPSHWIQGGPDEAGDHVRPLDDIEGHGHLLPVRGSVVPLGDHGDGRLLLFLSLPPQ